MTNEYKQLVTFLFLAGAPKRENEFLLHLAISPYSDSRIKALCSAVHPYRTSVFTAWTAFNTTDTK